MSSLNRAVVVALSVACEACRAEPPTVTVPRVAGSVAAPPLVSATRAPPKDVPPTARECDLLWNEYHAIVPEPAYIDHDGFTARCARSDRAVLGCVARVRSALEKMFADVLGEDAGPPRPIEPSLLAMGMATRIGVCLTRERVLFARRTGELGRLARELADAEGVHVVAGTFATLPWPGFHERGYDVERAPPGEIRVTRRPGGTTWIYFLGSMLGRHQNQIGFLYATKPFGPDAFKQGGAPPGSPGEEACISTAGAPSDAAMIPCFDVIERIAPDLVMVGATPD